jgi:signal transduction histidine kinase
MNRPALLEVSTLLARPRGALVLCGLMYLAAALHSVLLGPLGWPSTEVLWSAMLIPTIVLSFYWGRVGAAAALIVGLVLFVAVEWLVHGQAAFTGARLVFATTVFLAIVSIGIAIGGLAELLRGEYRRRVAAERAAATSELAVALKHEIHNPLAALVAEAQLLEEESASLPESQRQSVASVSELAQRIQALVDRVAEIEEPRRVEYLDGRYMTDLSGDMEAEHA